MKAYIVLTRGPVTNPSVIGFEFLTVKEAMDFADDLAHLLVRYGVKTNDVPTNEDEYFVERSFRGNFVPGKASK